MGKKIIIPHEFEILEEIGNGYFGKVYKIKDSWNDNILATKIIDINNLEIKMNKTKEEIKESIEKEINIMKKIKNQFSCEFLGNTNNKENYYLFMKLYDTDLQTLLKNKYANGMKIDDLKRSLSQLNVTFRKMYENNIVHRDIKPNNILIEYINEKKDFNVVLSDFGLGKYIKDETYLTLGLGTYIYMAPEIMNMENNYSNKVDLYSLGITILCMLNKKIDISEIYVGKIPKTNNTLLDDLLSKMLKFKPEQRINWNEYFNHKFFLYKDHTNLIENYISKKIDKDNNIIIIDNRITVKENIQLIIYGKKNDYDIIKYYEYYAKHCPRCDEGYGGYLLGVLRRAVSFFDVRGSGIVCHNCGYCYYFK
jgi:serine/threonine protein kinase